MLTPATPPARPPPAACSPSFSWTGHPHRLPTRWPLAAPATSSRARRPRRPSPRARRGRGGPVGNAPRRPLHRSRPAAPHPASRPRPADGAGEVLVRPRGGSVPCEACGHGRRRRLVGCALPSVPPPPPRPDSSRKSRLHGALPRQKSRCWLWLPPTNSERDRPMVLCVTAPIRTSTATRTRWHCCAAGSRHTLHFAASRGSSAQLARACADRPPPAASVGPRPDTPPSPSPPLPSPPRQELP